MYGYVWMWLHTFLLHTHVTVITCTLASAFIFTLMLEWHIPTSYECVNFARSSSKIFLLISLRVTAVSRTVCVYDVHYLAHLSNGIIKYSTSIISSFTKQLDFPCTGRKAEIRGIQLHHLTSYLHQYWLHPLSSKQKNNRTWQLRHFQNVRNQGDGWNSHLLFRGGEMYISLFERLWKWKRKEKAMFCTNSMSMKPSVW